MFFREEKKKMMDLARLGADDKTFITAIQEKTASALKIRDPIDRYLALQDIIEKNGSIHRRWNAENGIDTIYDSAVRENNASKLTVSVSAAFILAIFIAAPLGFSMGGAYGALCGFAIGLSTGVAMTEAISGLVTAMTLNRAHDKAKKNLFFTADKIDNALKPALSEGRQLFENEPQVAEYLQMKRNSKLSDLDIRAMVAKKFPPKTVTPDDLTVTLPESGAVKPSIKLKKE